MWNRISELWCQKVHTGAMWPIHGKYICPQCLREHRLAWEGPVRGSDYADPSLRSASMGLASVPSLVQ
ncbi:hypothetical protein SBA4_2600007 [Candidatus Sulfopaludibacter sp. SbA4]|nr:hypothetical protein SBA4_2600007 [Candidatus Sulfopaludibacter sp. SbA4]